ncbi:MAG: hypothetical protein KJ749_07585 [Planctomycetes bacterium]|nr:hypothetical protein [Planctomycetota bacterium]
MPISHTMGENVTVALAVDVTPGSLADTAFSVTGTGSPGFNFDGSPAVHGGANVLTLTSTDTIAEQFQWFAPSTTWRFERTGQLFVEQEASPKLVYVTMGTPRDTGFPEHQVTQIRMERAVDYASRALSLNPHAIVATIRDELGGYNIGAAQSNAWNVPDRGGDCQSIVRFMEKVVKMVDVPGTFEHKHIYAIETAPAVGIEVGPLHGGLNTDVRSHPTEPTWRLFLVDENDDCNAFEAAAKFTACGETLYYAGGAPDGIMINKDDVLKVFATLSWTELVGDVCVVREEVYPYPDVPAAPPTPSCP